MKIDKAIEILTLQSKEPDTPENIDFNLALILGIEALKRLHANRNSAWPAKLHELPGEHT